jgi:hypothetical protein
MATSDLEVKVNVAAEPPLLPYVDMIPTDFTVTPSPTHRGLVLTLQGAVPDVERFARNVNMNEVTQQVMDAIKSKRVRVRLMLVPDSLVESEFERLQDDGTVRDMLPQEGTW